MPLLEGTGAAAFADMDKPRAFDPGSADRAISIDEPLAGVERWRTSGSDEEVRDQIHEHVRQLLRDLAD
jgi:hypothetical protein